MKRLFTFAFAAVAMFVVAVLSAFGAMRLAIHGREIDVPNLAGMSDGDAATAAHKLGLELSVENRFYSGAIQPNHVLSQSPAAGSLVRSGSQVRVTESLGGQQVTVPDVTGQPERPAGLVLRRLQLDLGSTAHLPAPVPADIVIAQSPPANAPATFGPKVSVLVADDESEAPVQSYVMPQLVGMTLGSAGARLGSAGLRIASAQAPSVAPVAPAPGLATDAVSTVGSSGSAGSPAPQSPASQSSGTQSSGTQAPGTPASGAQASGSQAGGTQPDPAIAPTVVAPPPPGPDAVIVYQSPAAGHRVSRTDLIRVTVARTPESTPDPLLLPSSPTQP